MDPENLLIDAVNCSIGASPGATPAELVDRARQRGVTAVELWWPFATPTPDRSAIDDLVDALSGTQLVALNLFGGDLAAGDRGVLHTIDPTEWSRHLDCVDNIIERTGVRLLNTLVGRGGRDITARQRDLLDSTVARLRTHEATALIEPLSGVDDYPVCSVAEAVSLVESCPGSGFLADLYHLAAGGENVTAWLASVRTGARLPDHVQIADVPGRGAPGSGSAPLGLWVGGLRASGYHGRVVGEWLPEPSCG